jgi:hypothetical protein
MIRASGSFDLFLYRSGDLPPIFPGGQDFVFFSFDDAPFPLTPLTATFPVTTATFTLYHNACATKPIQKSEVERRRQPLGKKIAAAPVQTTKTKTKTFSLAMPPSAPSSRTQTRQSLHSTLKKLDYKLQRTRACITRGQNRTKMRE